MSMMEDDGSGEMEPMVPDLWNGPAPQPPGYNPGGSDAMVKALNTPQCHEPMGDAE